MGKFPAEAAALISSDVEAGPRAYLNWLVFDKDYNVDWSKSNFDRLSINARETGQDIAHEALYAARC